MSSLPPTDRLYLVAIPQGELLEYALRAQGLLAQRYGLYRRLPRLHVTLEMLPALSPAQLTRAIYIIDEICGNTQRLALESRGFQCFPQPHRAMVLTIHEDEALGELRAGLQRELGNMSLTRDYPDWQLHITIASTLYAAQPWDHDQYEELCALMPRGSVQKGYCEHLELWKSTIHPEPEILARFSLG
ncbi:MAG: 2'-5' RNA ligase family protein [Limnochordia bacterium]|jgi:2'-5' RNA ligase